MFKELYKYRDLLYMLVVRDIRIRYKQAAMGFLWAIFMPVMAVTAGIIMQKVVSVMSGKPMEMSGILSISVKVLPWTFFISSIRFCVQSLVSNMSLITKIYFPREVLPLASILACLFDFAIALAVLMVLSAVVGVQLTAHSLLVPVLLFLLVLFTTGLGLLLASANLFFRDVKYVVEIVLMFGIFFTPVFYRAETFGRLKPVLLLNPVGNLLEAIGDTVVLHRMPDPGWFLYAAVSSVVVFLAGGTIFRKTETMFAENI